MVQGCRFRRAGQYGVFLITLIVGCTDAPVDGLLPEAPASIGKCFEVARTGTVAGRIPWAGPVPQVKPLIPPPPPALPPPHEPTRQWPNPLRPLVESETRGVGDIVVFLRQV